METTYFVSVLAAFLFLPPNTYSGRSNINPFWNTYCNPPNEAALETFRLVTSMRLI